MSVVLAGLKDPDPAVRVAAAGSLGTMQMPRGVEALLDALPREKSPVAEAIALALGASRSDRAFAVITNLLDSVRIFSQNYHAGTVEFVEAARRVFTPEQVEAICR